MDDIIYEFIDYRSEKFRQVMELRYEVLFKPYKKVEKYEYDEYDDISLHLVALHKEKVVGYSRVTKTKNIEKITNVVVNLEYVNNGIGFNMIKRHIAQAKEDNIDALYLNARLDTINFYKKLGFECEEEVSISEKSGLLLHKMHLNI